MSARRPAAAAGAEQRGSAAGSGIEVLKVAGLHKSFGAYQALKGVDFSIAAGEKVCVLGSSGSGKTTFLRCLNLLIEPTRGSLEFQGQPIGTWPLAKPVPTRDLCAFRSRIGMVFQQFELFPHLTALANVTLGPRHARGEAFDVCRERGLALLRKVGLAEFADAFPRTLSGGQKQRVAIARALAMQPELVLFDEPTSALDAEMVGEVLDLMTVLAAEGTTMVIVTHEIGFARKVADRIVIMDKGVIVEDGPTRRMFDEPRHQRTRDLLHHRLASRG
ncbi:MAG: amino acid ABC transporter ATP-binding protein [Parvibaculaceae bacterium]